MSQFIKKPPRLLMYIVISFGIVLVSLVVFLHFFPSLLVLSIRNAQITRLNNPYVNSKYPSWRKEVFFETNEFLIPPVWDITVIDNSLYLISENGVNIAYVGKLGDGSRYRNTDEFCSAVIGSERIESPYEDAVYGEHFGNGCNAYQITAVNHQEQFDKYYYLLTKMDSNECAILFLNNSTNKESLLDYVIAIGYSYSFKASSD